MTDCINHAARPHALLSASSAHRWLFCPPSAVAAELYPDQDTEFTREGTLAHEVAELRARPGGPATLAEITKLVPGATAEMLECANGYADYIEEQIPRGRPTILLEQRVNFSPWVPDGFGTCDCIILQGRTMHVIDYKYGKGVAVSATENPQLRLYALGALNDYGIAFDVTTVRLHIYQPRLNNVSTDELAASDLLAWGKMVKPVAADAYNGRGDYNPGEHCRFCPHAGNCPALTKVCTRLVNIHGGEQVAVRTLAPFEVAEVLLIKPLVELWLRRVSEQALNTLLEGGEIPGYKVVEGRVGNRKWSDEVKVAEALKAAGYGLEDITETKLLSPAAMDKAVGKKKVAELLAGLIDRAPGSPVVVLATDKRPEYNPANDFENLEEALCKTK